MQADRETEATDLERFHRDEVKALRQRVMELEAELARRDECFKEMLAATRHEVAAE